ncbi:hypothetical protein [Saccharicrinis sp. GN24d3]|uniref:hypothetical protein n=1 Tax=Saccharicrinis sp. GN24d3 TaxID=3458416 RepID=UPI0040350045
MIIRNPQVHTHGFYFKCHKRLVTNFCDHYNEGKKSGEQLKSQHRRLIRKLIKYAAMVIDADRRYLNKDGVSMDYKLGAWEKINLSRFLEAKDFEVHPDTIKRYKKRLIKAGIIKASSADFAEHGRSKKHRSDVLINPDLFLVFDLDNPDYIPTTPFFSETDLLALSNTKSASCVPVSGSRLPQEQNNRIMDVDTVDKGVSSGNELPTLPEQNLIPDTTTKQVDPDQENKRNLEKFAQKSTEQSVNTPAPQEPEQGSARKTVENTQKADTLAALKLSFARTFYIYLVQKLFTNHDIYHGETQRAIDYLVQTYFSTVTSDQHARIMLKKYKTRVDMAASYIKRKNFDFSNIYPCAYLAVKNKKGFAATKAWYDTRISYKATQAKQKQEYDKQLEEKKVMQQLQQKFTDKPDLSEVNRAMAFLSANLPHKQNEYMHFVDNQQ